MAWLLPSILWAKPSNWASHSPLINFSLCACQSRKLFRLFSKSCHPRRPSSFSGFPHKVFQSVTPIPSLLLNVQPSHHYPIPRLDIQLPGLLYISVHGINLFLLHPLEPSLSFHSRRKAFLVEPVPKHGPLLRMLHLIEAKFSRLVHSLSATASQLSLSYFYYY